MKKIVLLVFLCFSVLPVYSAPYTPFPSPVLVDLEIAWASSFYEMPLNDYILLVADYHVFAGPSFSLYPGSLFPVVSAGGGAAFSLKLPFYSMLSLSAETGLLLNPMIGFEEKYLDLIAKAGMGAFVGLFYRLSDSLEIRFGGKMVFDVFTSLVFPVPFRFYYSGKIIAGLHFLL
ncbi:MAG: hypothetical protein JXR70_18900 [Spirochaetales bacterium]|nr:hypothetical protein [Spirochaetales bacterium]